MAASISGVGRVTVSDRKSIVIAYVFAVTMLAFGAMIAKSEPLPTVLPYPARSAGGLNRYCTLHPRTINGLPSMTRSQTLRVGGVPEHFNLPWRLALESGAFAEAGLNIDYQDYPSGTGAMTQALRSGALDIAILLTEGIVADQYRGNPSKIIYAYVDSPLRWGIHVPAGSDLTHPDQMAGRRYAISRKGSGSHLMAIVDAVERGWDPASLQFVTVDNLAGARQYLAAGDADIFLWERFMTQPLVDQGEFRRIGEILPPWPAFMVAATDAVITQRSADLFRMIQVTRQAVIDLLAREDTAALIAGRYGLAESEIELWLQHTRWNTNFDLPVATLRTVLQRLQQAEVIFEPLPAPDSLVHQLAGK